MDHEPVLISTIALGLLAAFVGGFIAQRLRTARRSSATSSPASLIGPFTPGFVADPEIAHELAEIGVILLMFGVGHPLLAQRPAGGPRHRRSRGRSVQIVVATLLGIGARRRPGWGLGGGLVLGLAVSVASTVVLLRALEDRGGSTRRRAASPSAG